MSLVGSPMSTRSRTQHISTCSILSLILQYRFIVSIGIIIRRVCSGITVFIRLRTGSSTVEVATM